ncbi:hypothetical protein [Actinokineospora sp.]|uniref:hypothetical protein n=1 Tax=Actinokineospora sp. TaxID=1872133 RepID=UPI004037E491
MSYAYVLVRWHADCRWTERLHLTEQPADSTAEDLVPGLRGWALELLNATNPTNDGEYTAFLIEPDPDGRCEFEDAYYIEDILWFYGSECVAVNT